MRKVQLVGPRSCLTSGQPCSSTVGIRFPRLPPLLLCHVCQDGFEVGQLSLNSRNGSSASAGDPASLGGLSRAIRHRSFAALLGCVLRSSGESCARRACPERTLPDWDRTGRPLRLLAGHQDIQGRDSRRTAPVEFGQDSRVQIRSGLW